MKKWGKRKQIERAYKILLLERVLTTPYQLKLMPELTWNRSVLESCPYSVTEWPASDFFMVTVCVDFLVGESSSS